MFVWRVTAKFQDHTVDEAKGLFARLVKASRQVPGVVSFDIAQDVLDPSTFVSVEVYEDEAAMRRQETLPELVALMAFLEGRLVSGPAGTIFTAPSCEPWIPDSHINEH